MDSTCAFAPATIANLNVGFDVLGIALNSLGDKVALNFNKTTENRITEIRGGIDLPTNIQKNCCSVVIQKMQEILNDKRGVDIRIDKGFPSGSGLGSSSASSAAAAFAYNQLMSNPFGNEELVTFSSKGELIACGTVHLDNVAPAIMGGFILVHNGKMIKLPVPKNLYIVSFFPMIKIKTSDSRATLNASISLQTATKQVANMGAFITSLFTENSHLFSNSLIDLIAEPKRKNLIPKFDEMKHAAMANNALAFGISGSGPSVFAITNNYTSAKSIEMALTNIFIETEVKTQSFVEQLKNNLGARICNWL